MLIIIQKEKGIIQTYFKPEKLKERVEEILYAIMNLKGITM